MLSSLLARRTCFYLLLFVLFAASGITLASAGSLTASYTPLRVSHAKTSSPASAASPKIVFGSVRNGDDHDIYVMDLDGSNQTRLTSHPAYDDQPKWSPDGNKIVFMSDRSGNFDVYSMNADGTNQTRLTNNPAAEGPQQLDC